MYEDVTYETILQRMLDRIPDTINKREGSIIYDALAPAAVELQNMYIELDWILQQSFADTAEREYLELRCAERGIEPEEASNAILKGEFNMDIPIGSRFSMEGLNYEAIEQIEAGVYQMQCETEGEIGNSQLGTLIPIDYISGLTSAQLTEVLIPGEDEEDTEVLRQRYIDSFESISFGGNKKDYIEKTNAIDGVGATKVTPVWNGGGTVKLTILDSTYKTASATLVSEVQEAIDPVGYSGEGYGLAPIGHKVTVQTTEDVDVNIVSTITFDEGYTFSTLKTQIESTIEAYLLELRQEWADRSAIIVRTAQIETRILAIDGVIDICDTDINGMDTNLTLAAYQVPVLGGVATV